MRESMAHPSSRSRAKTAVRVLLIGFLAVLLAVVFVFLSRRSDRPAAIRPETRPLTTQKVDVKENIHFVKDTGGRNILDVQAARNFTDAVGLYHLKGPEGEKGGGVRVESRARDGQLKFAAFAEEVIYDADWTRLVFRGGVEIRLDDLTVKGASFTYHKNRDAVVTNVPAVFEGRRFRGDCRRATYNVTDEYFVFSGGITLVTAPWDDDPVPVIITGKSMTYARQPRTGEIRGDVRIAHGRSRGRCNDVFFAQFPDKPEFRLFDFHGNVKWEADERAVPAAVPAKPKAGEASPADDELIFFQGGRQRMEAGSMMFVPYGTEGWARYGSMQGGARIDILGEAGRQTTLEARETMFFYDEGWALQAFRLQTRARIRGEAEGRMRLLEAPTINYGADSGLLAANGTAAEPARTISGGREITAEWIALNLQTKNLDARGGVKIVSHPEAGNAGDAALFASGRTTFMTAGLAHYEGGERQFRLGEGARLWQGRESLEGRDVLIFEARGDISASGNVRSVFFHRDQKKNEDQRVEVTGGRMARQSKKGNILFLDSCSLTVGEIVLKAGRLILEPGGGEDGEKYRRIIADQERVTVTQGANTARGDRAVYDLSEDVIVLTGNTVLEDLAKGVIHKDGKLTFHPSDGRILIENKDAERSTTIIKS